MRNAACCLAIERAWNGKDVSFGRLDFAAAGSHGDMVKRAGLSRVTGELELPVDPTPWTVHSTPPPAQRLLHLPTGVMAPLHGGDMLQCLEDVSRS
eukprot:1149076-Pelagomonas_calceolata.AAC.10